MPNLSAHLFQASYDEVSNCGYSFIELTGFGTLPGTDDLVFGFESTWGNVAFFVGLITITGPYLGYSTELLVGGVVNNSYYVGIFSNYEFGSGNVGLSFVGLATLVNGDTCTILASGGGTVP